MAGSASASSLSCGLSGPAACWATVKKNSNHLWAGVFVCESFGIILLIFTLLEMLEKMYVAGLESKEEMKS